MSFSTEQILFHNQMYSDRPDKRIVLWIDTNKIYHKQIKEMKYAKIGFTGIDLDTVIISFHKQKVKGSVKL